MNQVISLENAILLALVIIAILALISSFSKHSRIQDQQLRETFFREQHQGLLMEIKSAPTLTVLSGIEEAVDHFADSFQGRIDRELYKDLTGQLFAAIYNRRRDLKAFTQRTSILVKGKKTTFPFWM